MVGGSKPSKIHCSACRSIYCLLLKELSKCVSSGREMDGGSFSEIITLGVNYYYP